jgi:outer membrane protein
MEYSMRRLKKHCLFLIMAVLWASYPLYATSDQKGQGAPVSKGVSDTKIDQSRLSLEQCINIALKNNPKIAQKRWNTETAWTEKDIAQGRLWPQLSAVGGYTHSLDDRLITPRRPGGQEVLGFTDELVSGDIVLSMPLYTGARLKNAVNAAELMAQSTNHQYLRSRRELVFNVSNVFYSMLGQQEVIASLIFSQTVLEEHRKRVAELLDAQKAAKVDLLRTEVRLADILQQLLRERNVIAIQRILLTSLLGLDGKDDPLQIQGALVLTDVSAGLDRDLGLAFKHRQDYQSQRSRVDAQQKNLDLAKAGRLPEVSLRASYGNRWAGDSAQDNEVGQVGVFAMIPLFEGGRIKARISRECTRLIVQKEALRELRLQITLEVETAASNINSTRARIDVTQKASEQAKESLRIEREKYDLGKGAIVDVLDAQSALLDSQTNYYRALADYNTALAQFNLAVGETQ